MAPETAKIKILFIEASPPEEQQLDTGAEKTRLEDALWAGLNPTVFEVPSRSAVRSPDIEPSLRRHQPQVIHFSGHGNRRGELILNAPDGAASQPLSAEGFTEKLRRYTTDYAPQTVRLVVLVGCYTERAAQLVSEFVDCAIGMADAVGDGAMGDVFTPTLYRALGDGYSVAAAVAEARQELREHPQAYVREADAVRLYGRPGVDPAQWKLTDLAASTPVLSPAHRKYLLQRFEQRWAGVFMGLFNPALGHKMSLLKIYTPLPVDFAIHAQADKRGRLDWWCGRRGEDPARMAEAEAAPRQLLAETGRRLKRGEVEKGLVRPQRWADLGADAGALKPLVALAQEQLRAAQKRRERDRDENFEITWEADAHHAALVQPRFVLVGDPGSGKSTFLRHLTLCWAGEVLCSNGDTGAPPEAGLHALAGWSGPAFTPVYIELRSLIAGDAWSLERAATAPPGVLELREYLRALLVKEGCEAFTDELFDLLRAGRAAILLDGLDEVNQAADPRRRAQVQAFVGELAE